MIRVLLLLVLWASAARAEPFAVKVADMPSYGRIIVRLARAEPPTVSQSGDEVTLSLPGTDFATPDQVPRNVVRYTGGHGSASMVMVSGARLKTERHGRIFILVAIDPPTRLSPETQSARANPAIAVSPAMVQAPAAPHESGALPEAPKPVVAPPIPMAQPAPPSPPPVAAEPAEHSPVPVAAPEPHPPSPESVPLPTLASEAHQDATANDVPTPDQPPTPMLRIPAGPDVGAVAFRRDGLGIVVFDETLPITLDEEAGRLGRMRVEAMPRGTMLTLRLEDDETLALAREANAWIIQLDMGKGTPASETPTADGIAFQFSQPGRAMTASDPVTGQVMLLGTVRNAGGDHAFVAPGRSAPGYILFPTWLGLAMEANADAVDLRPTATGFNVQIPDRSAPAKIADASPANPFGIPSAPAAALLRQLGGQIASAAAAPPRSRGRERQAAARSMLGLGFAAEAQALLALASNDDPSLANDPATAALAGIAAVLAGRPAEAGGLDAPGQPASVDLAMWRGLRDLALGKPAPSLGETWPSLSSYPKPIRDRIAPQVMEAAARSGIEIPEVELAKPAFALARAEQLQAAGHPQQALRQFDTIADSRDVDESTKAARAGTELRLSLGELTPAAAADKLEALAIRWRGDRRELAIRLRAANLRMKAGQWRAALDSLKQTETVFPDAKKEAAEQRADVFRNLLAADPAAIDPLDFVTLAGDYADALPAGPDGERLAGLLAEKLVALDLPQRAIPILQRLMERADSPAKAAEFGLRLAGLRLDEGDPAKAEAVLGDIDPSALSQSDRERRIALMSRAAADRGNPAAAAAILAAVDTPATNELRASLLATAGDWPASLAVLQSVAAAIIPEQGTLDEHQQDLIVREATAAVQAGDVAATAALQRFDARLSPTRAETLHVLTASAVRSVGDLPRAARELATARALQARLSSAR